MDMMAKSAAPVIADAAVEAAPRILNANAEMGSFAMDAAIQETSKTSIISPIAGYFLAGALCVILIMVIWEFIKKK